MTDSIKLAEWCVARHSELKSERDTWDAIWQELAEFCLPRKAEIASKRSEPDNSRNDLLYDATAMQAASVLANGQLSYITPADARWFVFEPGGLEPKDEVKNWLAKCGEIAALALATSNFYAEVHELYYDDSVFGTYCMFLEGGRSHPLVFKKLDVGSYCLVEDDEGIITEVWRNVELTVSQAVERFGIKNLPEKIQKEWEEYGKTGKGGANKHEFVHAVFPRKDEDRMPGKADGPNKPWASVYVHAQSKHVCRNAGYDHKPFFAGRHVKAGAGPYGVSPAWMALPDSRQINFLVKQLDALAEVKAFPRFLIPSSHEGEIDLRAGGWTYFDENKPGAVPKEWLTSGDYNIGLEREKRKQDAINRAFHVDMFRMFSDINKQMTATEVAERATEKLVQFSPSFARKTTEFLTPMLRGVFGILIRGGVLPPPPQEAIITDAAGAASIAEPSVSYVSRVALAIRAMQNLALSRSMERQTFLAQVAPETLDNYDWDKISKDSSRNDGLPSDWIRSEADVRKIRKDRAQASARHQQLAEADVAADVMQKAGSVKDDSILGMKLKGAV